MKINAATYTTDDLRAAAVWMPGKSENEDGRVGGQKLRRIRQCEEWGNSHHEIEEVGVEKEDSRGKVHSLLALNRL